MFGQAYSVVVHWIINLWNWTLGDVPIVSVFRGEMWDLMCDMVDEWDQVDILDSSLGGISGIVGVEVKA